MHLFDEEKLRKKWTKTYWQPRMFIRWSGKRWEDQYGVGGYSVDDSDWIEYIEPKKKRKVTLWTPIRIDSNGKAYSNTPWSESKDDFCNTSNTVGWDSKEVEVTDENLQSIAD
jgi:hypothetical protein